MSLFGATTQGAQSSGGGLFGSNATQNNSATTGGSLFGSNANQNTTQASSAGSLFGAKPAQPAGGLFGSNTNTTAQTSTGGLFGSNTATATPASTGSLFGSNTNTAQGQNAGGLFGSNASNGAGAQAPASGGLFGSNNTAGQPTTGGGLFGGQAASNNTQPSGGLFGSSLNQKPAGTSLFGSAQPAQPTQSLFGSTANTTAQPSLFGSTAATSNQPQSTTSTQHLGTSLYSVPAPVSVGAQGHLISSASLQRLAMSGYSTVPNEKRVADQIRTLTGKWNPQDENTLLRAYVYNAVDKSYAPFFYPNTANGEDAKSWEEALSQRPSMPKIEGAEANAMAFVPVLCRGFKALGDRVETQAKNVLEMRARLHEMNNSLSAIMDKHQQSITVKVENAKRQHQILSQRCLRLAVKVQVLRNRGYALDAAEEGLRRTLINLSQQVQSDALSGREDEIWARMVALRERTRWLEEEGRRVSAQVNEQNRQASNDTQKDGIPEHVLLKTKKILKDYQDQLAHLSKELTEVNGEFTQWQTTQNR